MLSESLVRRGIPAGGAAVRFLSGETAAPGRWGPAVSGEEHPRKLRHLARARSKDVLRHTKTHNNARHAMALASLSGPSRRDPATSPQKRPEHVPFFPSARAILRQKAPKCRHVDRKNRQHVRCARTWAIGAARAAVHQDAHPALYKKVRARVRCARTVPPVGPFQATDRAGRRGAMAQTAAGGRRVLRIARAQAGVCRCGGDALQARRADDAHHAGIRAHSPRRGGSADSLPAKVSC